MKIHGEFEHFVEGALRLGFGMQFFLDHELLFLRFIDAFFVLRDDGPVA
jgi:hypothetical protein